MTNSHASESGHWYDRHGKSVWEVVGAKGQKVKPDLRHARKLGLLPGVTSVANCAAKPGLEMWKVKQAILSALTLPRAEAEPEDAWLDRIVTDSNEQSRKAADRGTLIHAAIQAHYQGEIPDPEFLPYVRLAVEVIRKNCGEQQWTPEKSFAHEAGYGGKADLPSTVWLVDVKSKDRKDLDDPKKKLVYDEHPQQLAAYRRGLLLPNVRCANLFISRDPETDDAPILCKFIEHPEEDLKRGLDMFDALLRYWQIRNRYDSSFSRLELAA